MSDPLGVQLCGFFRLYLLLVNNLFVYFLKCILGREFFQKWLIVRVVNSVAKCFFSINDIEGDLTKARVHILFLTVAINKDKQLPESKNENNKLK